MVLLDRLWDDTVTGPQPHPQRSLNKVYTRPFNIKDIGVEGSIKYQRSLSMPSPTPLRKENIGTNPTVYDWLYSGETRSKHHQNV
ncbi:auxin-repressed 12.5 kDa protein-like isoform X2 [Salvia hispanica]|uniref:auxin-repressed 12.5 kDa protein-like isoform X2 n=1 Tax=Salvia hispanica TaxID=49212 RepID=UPI0020099464|nr:auxin-repressed 12.5 kDa protein-like isoform X2 [Salvia hispanica]